MGFKSYYIYKVKIQDGQSADEIDVNILVLKTTNCILLNVLYHLQAEKRKERES